MWNSASTLDTKENSKEVAIPINAFTLRSMEELNQLFSDRIPDPILMASHIFDAHNFKGMVEAVDKFCKSNKTLSSCCISAWKNLQIPISMDLAYINSLKHCFCTQKEYYIWKLPEFNRINDDDLKDFELNMEIIKPQGNLSNKQKIVEIRNALEHHKYLTCREWIYINNPKNSDPRIHARDFVAKVPYSSLQEYVWKVWFVSRKMYSISPNYSKDLNFNKSYKEQKDKIWFEVKKSFQKEEDRLSRVIHTEQEYQNRFNELDVHNLQLSEKQQDILSLFFEKNKLSHSNLEYVASSLQDYNRKDIVMIYILWELLKKEFSSNNFEQFKKNKDVLKSVKRLSWGRTNTVEDAIHSSGWENWEKTHDCSVVRELWEMLVSGWEINTLANRRQDYLKYVDRFFKKRGFKYKERYLNLWPCFIKKELSGKLETIIPLWIISSLLDNLHTEDLVVERMFKEFSQWLKMQFIKTIFIDWLVEVPSEWHQKPNVNDEFTIYEHIRNALTHNTFTMFYGINTILLRDWYNKKTNQWEREESFNINDLYNLPFKTRWSDRKII